MDPKWFNVNQDSQIWSGHSDNHQKMGKLIAPAGILAIDFYKGSYQFKKVMIDDANGGKDQRDPLTEGYNQYWIREEDVSEVPYNPDPGPFPGPDPEDPLPVPEPVPSNPGDPSNEEIGRVIRFLYGR